MSNNHHINAKHYNYDRIDNKPRMPQKGELVYPDREGAKILSWPSNSSNSWVAKINVQGRAITSVNYQGPAITCFLSQIPIVGQAIKITKVNQNSVCGKLVTIEKAVP